MVDLSFMRSERCLNGEEGHPFFIKKKQVRKEDLSGGRNNVCKL